MAKTAKTTPLAQAPLEAKAKPSARIQVRRSGVHGRGVYALQAFEPGDFVIEYLGEHISWDEMQLRHEAKEGDPFHTFFFQTESGNVIDGGGKGRNAARWINHSCEANCETQEDDDGHVFITAIAPIAPGEEFFYDYALEIDEPLTLELKNDYACRCGSASCRGTMLKTRRRAAKKSPSKAAAAPAPTKNKVGAVSQEPVQVQPAVKAKRQTTRKAPPVETTAQSAVKARTTAKTPPAAKKLAKTAAKQPLAQAAVQAKPAVKAKRQTTHKAPPVEATAQAAVKARTTAKTPQAAKKPAKQAAKKPQARSGAQ